jgi:hypothetical protein
VAPDFPAWSGQYRITYPGGTHDEGNAVAAHLVPDAGAPSFEGDWSGDGLATPGVDCRLTPSERDENLFDGSFVQDRSGVISGRITLTNDGGSDPQTFDLTGQAFGGNGVSDDGLVLVGSSDRALIVIQLNLPRPPSGPQLKGSYLMLNDAGRPTCETGSITLTSSDSGVGTAP